jgi:hypothetical protein
MAERGSQGPGCSCFSRWAASAYAPDKFRSSSPHPMSFRWRRRPMDLQRRCSQWGRCQRRRRPVEWKMEIVDSRVAGPYKVALILGHPRDLDWYQEGRERGCYVLIAIDNKEFYLVWCPPSASRQRLTLNEADLRAMTTHENLVLKLPLAQGDCFGGNPGRGVNDVMYAWCVLEVRREALSVRGLLMTVPSVEYDLIYRANPDHEIDTYVPGAGLTAYVYSHHGAVSEVNVKLVEFHGKPDTISP